MGEWGSGGKGARKRGLTLLEVMLAVVILSVGMVVLLAAVSRCLRVVKAAELYEDARHLLGQVEMIEPLVPCEIEEGSDSGRFQDSEFSDYRWRRDIYHIGEEDEDRLFEIRTRVIWSEKGNKPYEEIVTYLYDPCEEDEI